MTAACILFTLAALLTALGLVLATAPAAGRSRRWPRC
jgi:hypothetical protein